jgi:glutamine---fructose-6-phosphate transaminase (isomerizing)
MCGIVGYIGLRDAAPILLDGLRRLEYRGYDSAGIAIVTEQGTLEIRKNEGKLAKLVEALNGNAPQGHVGVGHTRWATHGAPNDMNAHPHTDCTGRIAVVHNGIVENFGELRDDLAAHGHEFTTETDTEVLAHLIEDELRSKVGNGDSYQFISAVQRALRRVHGTYGIGVLDLNHPELLIGARHFSPLVIGIGENENLLASDIPALLPHTRRALIIEDGEIAALTRDSVHLYSIEGDEVERDPFLVTWDEQSAEKGGFPHFFLKEIHEQPAALANAIRGRVTDTIRLTELDEVDLGRVNRVVLLACGSSYHAALVGKRALEQWSRVPAEAVIASEFRYARPVIDEKTLAILITQSGETADTIASLRLARSAGAQTLALTNTVGSSTTRGVTAVVNLHVGPEIGVVASKTFSAQVLVLELIAIDWARRRGLIDAARIGELAREIALVPDWVEGAMGTDMQMQYVAKKISSCHSCFFFGRGYGYPTALEGALKLKEISYLHAEGYPAGELKHGPIAMLDPEIPVIAIATDSGQLEKVLSNIQEVRARRAHVIAVATDGDQNIAQVADEIVYLPRFAEEFTPIIATLPLQLLAYYVAVQRGCDVDQPRNLAKSVTVE